MGHPLHRPPAPGPWSAAVESVGALEPEAWNALAARAIAPQPFYGRRAIAAHQASGLAPAGLAAVVVRGTDGLEAVLPFELRADVIGLGGTVAQPFLSRLVTASLPLVAEGPALDDRLDALVEGLALASGGRCWRWPLLPVAGRLGAGLLAAMARAGWGVATVAAFARPVLDRRADHAAFLAGHPHRGRLKDLRRRRRRLGESGTLAFVSATEGPALEQALEEFLALEAAGWKGAAGTALRCGADTEALARALFRADGAPAVRADLLRLDGRTIAASLALVAGGTAFLLKTAYDEGSRAQAPGLVLEADIVRALHDTAFADRLDSATLPGSVLESLYPDRETIAEILAVPPGPSLLTLEQRVHLARLAHRARAEAKRLLGRR
ncbi:GNAT family N-acetyltransferase [Methylobacterium sp. Leaf118]|uniref:GNAT family N-acetyltransferase n=1 Tax=Methylobacterium sp. Leaf118 TaxID=2876562 RepID=UPI001E5107CE|nr:GNAT family N-acetyltransferase [Methylobacterium sp. Leaf118]